MMRSMFALQPYLEVTTTQGVVDRRVEILTDSMLGSLTAPFHQLVSSLNISCRSRAQHGIQQCGDCCLANACCFSESCSPLWMAGETSHYVHAQCSSAHSALTAKVQASEAFPMSNLSHSAFHLAGSQPAPPGHAAPP